MSTRKREVSTAFATNFQNSLEESTKLDVPFVSQQNNSIANDCGPACLAMLTGAPIEKVYQVGAWNKASNGRFLGSVGLLNSGRTALVVEGIRCGDVDELLAYREVEARRRCEE